MGLNDEKGTFDMRTGNEDKLCLISQSGFHRTAFIRAPNVPEVTVMKHTAAWRTVDRLSFLAGHSLPMSKWADQPLSCPFMKSIFFPTLPNKSPIKQQK